MILSRYLLRLLGTPCLEGPEGPVPIKSIKGQALLWYCASHPDKLFPRGHISLLLWPNTDQHLSRNSLSSMLVRMKKGFPLWPLSVDAEQIGWNVTHDEIDVDLVRFEELTACANATLRSRDDMQRLEAAVNLWRGPFLQEFELADCEEYGDWVLQTRQMWELRIMGTLLSLISFFSETGSWEKVALYCRKALAIDPLQEDAHRSLMQALARSGDRVGALMQYLQCQQILEKELRLKPDPLTTALRDQIARGHLLKKENQTIANPPAPKVQTWTFGAVVQMVKEPEFPLVGHEQELSTVLRLFASQQKDGYRMVFLHGEAGIGKTRLTQEVLWRLRMEERFPILLVGQCDEDFKSIPFAPFIEALRPLVSQLDFSQEALLPWKHTLRILFPEISIQESINGTVTDLAQNPHLVCEAVTAVFRHLAIPVILDLEDLHWADESTLLLLSYLVRRRDLTGFFLLANGRSGELPEATRRSLNRLVREGYALWFDLSLLTYSDLEEMVHLYLGTKNPSLTRMLHISTKGNPLFAVETLRYIKSQEDQGDRDSLGEGSFTLPHQVEGVIHDRISRLPEPVRDLLATISIFRRAATLPLLQRICGQSEPQILSGLEHAMKAGLIREISTSSPKEDFTRSTNREIAFHHDLIRQAVRDGMSDARRSILHKAAFQCLVERPDLYGPTSLGSLAETLAYHAMFWGVLDETEITEMTPASVISLMARRSLLDFLDKNLNSLNDFQPGTPLAEEVTAVRQQIAKLLTRDLPIKADPLSGRRDPMENAPLTMVQAAQSIPFSHLGDLKEILPFVDKTVVLARKANIKGPLSNLLTLQGTLFVITGFVNRVPGPLNEAIDLFQEMGREGDILVARLFLMNAHSMMGDFEKNDQLAPLIMKQCQNSSTMSSALFRIGTNHFIRGEWQQAQRMLEESVAYARSGDHRMWEYLSTSILGPVTLFLEGPQGALRLQQKALSMAKGLSIKIYVAHNLGWMAKSNLELGDLSEAEALARAGVSIGEENYMLNEADLSRMMLAETLLAKGERNEALAHAQRALEGFSHRGVKPNMARCHLLLAQCTDDPKHVQKAFMMFKAMGMNGYLKHLQEKTGTKRPIT